MKRKSKNGRRKPVRGGKKSNKVALRNPVTYQNEIRYTSTDAECVYIGHAVFPVLRMYDVAAMTLVQVVAEKMRLKITRWTDVCGFTCTASVLGYSANTDTGNPGVLFTQGITATDGWKTVSDNLRNKFIIQSNTNQQTEYFTMKLDTFTAPTGQDTFQVNLKNNYIHFNCQSQLKFQNATVSETGAAAVDTAITRNVLHGTKYDCSNGGFEFKQSRVTTGRYVDIFGNGSFGASSAAEFKIPVLKSVLSGVKSTAPVNLGPGEILVSKLVKKGKISFNAIFMKNREITGGASAQACRKLYGGSRWYALQKLVELSSGGATITVNCENEFKSSAKMHEKLDSGSPTFVEIL